MTNLLENSQQNLPFSNQINLVYVKSNYKLVDCFIPCLAVE